MVVQERKKAPHTLFYSKDAKYMKYMRTFGEMAAVAIHEGKKMRSNSENREKTCMFVRYAERSFWGCIQIPEHPHIKNHHEKRCKTAEHSLETLWNEKHLENIWNFSRMWKKDQLRVKNI